MKKILNTCIAVLCSLVIFAQSSDKPDVILKLNGEELSGKILEMDDNEIKFSYTGETLVYKVKKQDVLKITFGSGRIEVINKQPLPSQQAAGGNGPGLADHHNKVAILPFSYLQDGQASADDLSLKVQTETYSYIKSHAGIFTVLDPRTTNAMLIKAGINSETIKGYTMEDLCNVLGVEYVVDGIVSVNKGTQSNYSSGNSTTKYDSKTNDKNQYKSKESSSGSAITTSVQNYETSLTLNIYNDKGDNLYGKER